MTAGGLLRLPSCVCAHFISGYVGCSSLTRPAWVSGDEILQKKAHPPSGQTRKQLPIPDDGCGRFLPSRLETTTSLYSARYTVHFYTIAARILPREERFEKYSDVPGNDQAYLLGVFGDDYARKAGPYFRGLQDKLGMGFRRALIRCLQYVPGAGKDARSLMDFLRENSQDPAVGRFIIEVTQYSGRLESSYSDRNRISLIRFLREAVDHWKTDRFNCSEVVPRFVALFADVPS